MHVSASGATDVTELRCPHCRKRLVTVRVEAVDLSGCPGCGGIWIDNDSARRVLGAPAAIFGELANRAAANARDRMLRAPRASCPACPALLDRVMTHGIDLDVCGEHGTWFDAYELSQLIRVLNGEAPPSPLKLGEEREILCAGCGAQLSTTRADITDMGLTCESCWRVRLDAIVDEGERITQRNGAIAVGGVRLGIAGAMLGAAAASRSS